MSFLLNVWYQEKKKKKRKKVKKKGSIPFIS